MKQLALDLGLAPAPTLEGFLPAGNEHAVQQLRAWLEHGGGESIYLWGPPGCGKTHLLRALHGALAARGEAAGWLDATAPANVPFSESWHAAFMDDVQAYDDARQHLAFNWFVNAAAPERGAPRAIIAAGSVPPVDLPLRDDLRTRLAWGQVFELQHLSEAEMRCALQRAAHARGLRLPDALTDYVLARHARDLGSLMALLDRLDIYALERGRAATIPLFKEMLQEEEGGSAPP
ncbi:MAG: DnaA regulatory inactivator Hda [Ottowia sp.]|nr:DnaA regulatory inactivator Hda [Ottowia sp.]